MRVCLYLSSKSLYFGIYWVICFFIVLKYFISATKRYKSHEINKNENFLQLQFVCHCIKFDVLQNNICMENPIASIRKVHHTDFPIICTRKKKRTSRSSRYRRHSSSCSVDREAECQGILRRKNCLPVGNRGIGHFFPLKNSPRIHRFQSAIFYAGPAERISWEIRRRLFFFFFSALTREALRRCRNHRKNKYERENTVDETKLRLFRIHERSKSNWYRSIERCPLFINPLVIPALLNGASSPTGPRARVIWIRCPVSPLLCVNCIIFTPNTFRP